MLASDYATIPGSKAKAMAIAAACDRVVRMRDGKIREEIRNTPEPVVPMPPAELATPVPVLVR